MKAFLAGLAIFVTGLMVAAPADALVFPLTSCHVTGGCGTQTIFGSVSLTDNLAGGVNFDVVLFGGNRFVETGAADQQLFKFNGTGIVAADIVNEATVPAGVIAGGVNGTSGTFNGDGTGAFGFGVACIVPSDCNGGSTPVFSELKFTVNGATIAELTAANADGNVFVADVLIASNGLTGPVDASGGGVGGLTIPEPATLLLLGSGLLGLGLAGRVRGRLRK